MLDINDSIAALSCLFSLMMTESLLNIPANVRLRISIEDANVEERSLAGSPKVSRRDVQSSCIFFNSSKLFRLLLLELGEVRYWHLRPLHSADVLNNLERHYVAW